MAIKKRLNGILMLSSSVVPKVRFRGPQRSVKVFHGGPQQNEENYYFIYLHN